MILVRTNVLFVYIRFFWIITISRQPNHHEISNPQLINVDY